MICSVLIPSRKRFDHLKRCVQSICDTADMVETEIIVRLHSDDIESVDRLRELDGAQVIVGEPLLDYTTHGKSFMEMIPLAQGDWIFSPTDDSYITGQGWDEWLKDVEKEKWICAPEWFRNGGSTYHRCSTHPTPIVPRKCGIFNKDTFAFPHDIHIWRTLRSQGWKPKFIKGMTFHHSNLPHVSD